MRLDIVIHHPEGEFLLALANADLQVQVNRAINYIEQLQADNADLTKRLADADTGEDEADAADISSQLDAAGVPPITPPSGGQTGSFQGTVNVSAFPTSIAVGAVENVTGAATVDTGQNGPFSFSATGLPDGLTLDSSGNLSGSATAAGPFSVVVTATDASGNTGTASTSGTVA